MKRIDRVSLGARFLFPAAFVFLAPGSTAGSAASGILSFLHFMPSGIVIAYTSGARSDVPSCASSQPGRFALDSTTPAGKVQLAGLLSAYAATKQVVIVGTGACAAWPDTESVSYFHTDP